MPPTWSTQSNAFHLAHGATTVVHQYNLFKYAGSAHAVMSAWKDSKHIDSRETHVTKHSNEIERSKQRRNGHGICSSSLWVRGEWNSRPLWARGEWSASHCLWSDDQIEICRRITFGEHLKRIIDFNVFWMETIMIGDYWQQSKRQGNNCRRLFHMRNNGSPLFSLHSFGIH